MPYYANVLGFPKTGVGPQFCEIADPIQPDVPEGTSGIVPIPEPLPKLKFGLRPKFAAQTTGIPFRNSNFTCSD
jgi:hypothetical protein